MSGSKKWTSELFTSIAAYYNSYAEDGMVATSKMVHEELEVTSSHVFSMVSVQWHFGHFKSFAAAISALEVATEEDWRSLFAKWLRVRNFRFTSSQKEIILRMGEFVRSRRDKETSISVKLAKARKKKGVEVEDEDDTKANKWMSNAVATVVRDVFGQEVQRACRRAIADAVTDTVSKRILRGIADTIQPHIVDILAPQIEKIRASRHSSLNDIVDGEDDDEEVDDEGEEVDDEGEEVDDEGEEVEEVEEVEEGEEMVVVEEKNKQ